jgi:hypothetical protein
MEVLPLSHQDCGGEVIRIGERHDYLGLLVGSTGVRQGTV